MKYIVFTIEMLIAFGLLAIAVNYLEKGFDTFGIIFILLSLDRYDAANLYWKMKDDK